MVRAPDDQEDDTKCKAAPENFEKGDPLQNKTATFRIAIEDTAKFK